MLLKGSKYMLVDLMDLLGIRLIMEDILGLLRLLTLLAPVRMYI